MTQNIPTAAGIDLSGDAFAPLAPPVRLAFLLAPPAGFGVILLLAAMVASPRAAGFVAGLVAGGFVGGGKLVILAGAVERAPVGPWALAATIVYIDVATSVFALGAMYYLYRVPAAGRALAAARAWGWELLQRNPWMHRLTWVSLAGLVALPFHGTGAMMVVVMGRLLGLSRVSIVSATGCGSLVGSSALALAGDYWEERVTALAARPLLGITVVVVVVGFMILGPHLAFGRAGGPAAEDGGNPS